MSNNVDRIVDMMKMLSASDQRELQTKLSRHNVAVDFRDNCFNVEIPTRLGRGVRVRTGSADLLRQNHVEYAPEARPHRKPNKEGVISGVETGHGICYRVEFDGGGGGYFEPEELTILPVPRVKTR